MASRTSSQTGDWNQTATWGGAAVPGIGDDATVASGHTVTITQGAPVTVGNSTATGTVAVTLVGNLVLNDVLSLRGDLSQQRTASVTGSRVGSNTGGVTFDPPVGATYRWITPNTGTGTPTITITGESGDRVPITTSARGGGNGYFDFTNYPPTVNWDYVTCSNIGSTGDTTSTRALSYAAVSASSVTIQHTRWVSCGKLYGDCSGFNNFTWDIRTSDWRSPLHTDYLQVVADTAKVSGTRQITDCTFHHTAARNLTFYARDFTVDGGVQSNVKIAFDVNDTGNLVRNIMQCWNATYGSGAFISANVGTLTVEESAWLVDQTACDNPHYCISPKPGFIVQDCVADGLGATGSDDGDFMIPAYDGVSPATNPVVQRCLLINKTGTLFSSNTVATGIIARQNTMAGSSKGATVGETSGAAGNVARFSSNLSYGLPSGILQDASFVSQTGLNLDYNGCYSMSNAANLDIGANNGYVGPASIAAWWTAGSYGQDNKGQHDIYADPQFVDASRTTLTWYDSVFGSGSSYVNVRNEMLKMNGTDVSGSDATFNAGMTLAALKAYLRAGFAPQNTIYRAAGDPDDGSPDIGAVAVVSVVLAVELGEPHIFGGSLF